MRSVFIALIFTFGLSAAGSTAELQPKSIAFLKELGINPSSAEVTTIIDDQVGEYSLDALAARRNEDGVKSFIATRNFIRQYRKNTKTPQPSIDLYQIRYLTAEEKKFISAQLMIQ